MPKRYFLSGIGTDVGKTYVSKLLCQAKGWDYWKPIQAGLLPGTDRETVKSFLTHPNSTVFPERFVLKEPMSPHAAADIDNISIEINDLEAPETVNTLLIEGAGGLLVPINAKAETIADLIPFWKAEVILVANFYLGSINHTLLSIEYLLGRKYPIAAIIFNGAVNEQSLLIIKTKFPQLNYYHITDNKLVNENIDLDLLNRIQNWSF